MQEFLKELFMSHYSQVYSYLYSLSHDAALSEDLASDVFVEAVRSIHKFRGDSDIKTWLFSIARFKWYSCLRKQKKALPMEPMENMLLSTGITPETEYMKKELTSRILLLLEAEPERTGRIVQMRLEGYSFHEIGEELGISESSARVIDHRAKLKIRKELEKEGFGNE